MFSFFSYQKPWKEERIRPTVIEIPPVIENFNRGRTARVIPVTKLLVVSFVTIVVVLAVIVISWYAGYSFEVYNEHIEGLSIN